MGSRRSKKRDRVLERERECVCVGGGGVERRKSGRKRGRAKRVRRG